MSTFHRRPYGKRPAPLSIRLTPEERQHLEQLAGSMSLAGFIKIAALQGYRPSRTPTRTRHDQKALAKVLAALGASQLAASLERLSYAAANGSLYVDDRLAAKFAAACDDISAMHLHLLEALGKKPPKTPVPGQRLGIRFAPASGMGGLRP
ncbi:hypothetical protein [Pelagibacterium lacus]|uniref:Uncharacterized protein n=1 Tax=Pelagibacterium lacus TaxID=2282655 RepID=A0A369W396_9HYPH|nr:hypothetical protein [Pelagibacterium lacus]RDE07830.1 hypothetical protein DVH29_14580 [Pelagibacterium lacus]